MREKKDHVDLGPKVVRALRRSRARDLDAERGLFDGVKGVDDAGWAGDAFLKIYGTAATLAEQRDPLLAVLAAGAVAESGDA